MISALAAGFVFGLSSGLAPGPLMVLVITQSVKHGAKEGITVALAPLVTDLPIILVSLFALTRVDRFHPVLAFISLAGATYVFYLSYECFRTKPATLGGVNTEPRSLRKGVVINLLNPHPYLFWLTFGGPFVLKVRGDNPLAPFAFIFSFYLLLVGSKVFLALTAGKSRVFLRSTGYLFVMRGLAFALALFAFFLVKDAMRLLAVAG